MIQMKYDFPLPNNGDRYDLSEKELVKLLDAAYKNGYDAACAYTTTECAVSSSEYNTKAYKMRYNK